jgi:hypothetical protein
MSEPEIWRLIPSLPGVLASSHGRIMRAPHFKPLPNGGVRQYGGRATFGQWDGERFIYTVEGKTSKVARLVCEAFNGAPPAGMNCLHRDENSRNNVPSNLKWGTQKENLNAPGFLEYCRARTGENSPIVKGRRRVA